MDEQDVGMCAVLVLMIAFMCAIGLVLAYSPSAPYNPQNDIGYRLRANQVYHCPACDWSGMTGLMNAQPISGGVRPGLCDLYCPECGYYMGYSR